MRGSNTGELVFENCEVPGKNYFWNFQLSYEYYLTLYEDSSCDNIQLETQFLGKLSKKHGSML